MITRATFGRIFDQSLRTRLVMLDLLLFVGVASFLLLWLPKWMDRNAKSWVERNASAQVELLSVAIAPVLGDSSALDQMLGLLHTQPDARCAQVLDRSGAILARWGLPSACLADLKRATSLLLVSKPIVTEDGAQGSLDIVFSVNDFEKDRRETKLIALLVSLGVLGAGGLFAFVVGGILVVPLERLTESALRVARGQMDLEAFRASAGGEASSRSEPSRLAHALTLLTGQMLEQIRQLEQERERALYAEEQALASSKAKSTFLATMSHELRTPLNAIIGYAEMMSEEIDAGASQIDRQVTDLAHIRGSGQHLLSLINDVLDLSKIEAGRFDLLLERFPFVPFAQEIEQHVRPLASRNGNTLRFVGIDAAGEIVNDRTRLKQCVLNLLSNACKFTRDGLIELHVQRRLERGIDTLHISVIDNGIGIGQEAQRRLFLEFEQADASTTRRYGGTGLGLALTRRICRLMGGDVTVRSEINCGSVFMIIVPAHSSWISTVEPGLEAASRGTRVAS